MKTIEIKKIDNEGVVTMYTLQFIGDELSEFEKFIKKFKDNAQLKRDYQIIIYALSKMTRNGAKERYFRPEGKLNDHVCAIPVESGRLRLYCLRISDQILIIGNGGLKSTKTYEESDELSGYVMDLQKFDGIIKKGVDEGLFSVKETEKEGINNQMFSI
ncbi:MAG: hypothetical protein K5901_03200 [Bacteroidales bacterium]|nr:hypothetical protein [Bacteroidales bacterium]